MPSFRGLPGHALIARPIDVDRAAGGDADAWWLPLPAPLWAPAGLRLLAAAAPPRFAFTGGDVAGAVTEGAQPRRLLDTGTLSFSELDLTRVHTVSVRGMDIPFGGRLTAVLSDPATGDGEGAVTWTYRVADANLQRLGEGETATETFRITVRDDAGARFVQWVTVTLTGTDDAPVAEATLVFANAGQAIEGRLGATDADATAVLGFALTQGPEHGRVVVQADGRYVYTPGAGFVGSDKFDFVVSDGMGGQAAGRAEVTVDSGLRAAVTPVSGLRAAVNPSVPADILPIHSAALADGGHVVVWQSRDPMDPSLLTDVHLQRYGADGQKIGGPEQVNLTTAGRQGSPEVAGLSDGGMVVAWYGEGTDGLGVYQRVYSAAELAGGASGPAREVLVAPPSGYPGLAALTHGGYVMTWGVARPDGRGSDIVGQVRAADGAAVSGVFIVGAPSPWDVGYMGGSDTVVGLAGGRLAVMWNGSGPEAQQLGLQVRVFEADGTAVVGSQALVGTSVGGSIHGPSIARLGTGFVVVWAADSEYGAAGMRAQRFDESGGRLGDEIAVSTSPLNFPFTVVAAELHNGSFVIAWDGVTATVSTSELVGQHFDAHGRKLGGEFQIGDPDTLASDTGFPLLPTLITRADGALVVNWHENATTGEAGSRFVVGQTVIDDLATDTKPLDGGPQATSRESAGATADGLDAAALPGGGHALVWTAREWGVSAGPSTGIYLQHFDVDGASMATALRVNSTTAGLQFDPGVATLSDGTAVVVWTSSGSDGASPSVQSQLISAAGWWPHREIAVNQVDVGPQAGPTVSALAGGGYVVTWTGSPTDRPSNTDVYARVFSNDGTAVTGDIVVNTLTSGAQFTSGLLGENVVGLAGGRFAVTWTHGRNGDGTGSGVFVRLFEADGQPVGNRPALVNTFTPDDQHTPSIAALGTGFVVTWTSDGQDGSGAGVFAQRFDPSGQKLGGEVAVNTTTVGDQSVRGVVALSDGGFVVAWAGTDPAGVSQEVYGQRFDAHGLRVNGEFIMHTGDADTLIHGNQTLPTMAVRDDGTLLVAWLDDDRYRPSTVSRDGLIEQKVITDFAADTLATASLPVPASRGVPLTAAYGLDSSALPGGGHVVVWSGHDGSGAGGTPASVHLQRYDAEGQTAGMPQAVTLGGAVDARQPGVAALADGTVVVVWAEAASLGTEGGIYSRMFAADGAPAAVAVRVSQAPGGSLQAPDVRALAGGGYVITWTAPNAGTGLNEVAAQVFDNAGQAQSAEIVVIAPICRPTHGGHTTAGLHGHSLVGLSGGGFAVTWVADNSAVGTSGAVGAHVVMRMFEADGSAAGFAPVRVQGNKTGDIGTPSIAALGDGVVVAWTTESFDGRSASVLAQRFDAAGIPVGDTAVITALAMGRPVATSVTALADGGYVVGWDAIGPSGRSTEIYGQRMDAAGQPVGGEFLINRVDAEGFDVGGQAQVSLLLREDGAVVAHWLDDHRGTYNDTPFVTVEQSIIPASGFEWGGAKRLVGGAGPDSLAGSRWADTLDGAGGNDRLDGRAGADRLTGGAGADEFVFSSGAAHGQVDTLTDFAVGVDRLLLQAGASAFPGLALGALDAASFDRIGDGVAVTAATRLVYDPATGHLAFDVDGAVGMDGPYSTGDSGGQAAIIFAILISKPDTFSAADIFIV